MLNALDEAHEVLRAYDVKSEVLGVLLTLIVGVLNFSYLGNTAGNFSLRVLLAVASSFGFLTVLLAGLVLYPMKDPNKNIDTTSTTTRKTYFVVRDPRLNHYSLSTYLSDIRATDWPTEIAYEILKTSNIRDRKHFWFKLAMWAALATIALSSVTVIAATLCFTK